MTPAEYRKLKKPAKKNKYNNKRVVVDGIKFDSAGQARRYGELKLLERAGVIRSLCCEPVYGLMGINRTLVCKFKPDFGYIDNKSNKEVVEDFKCKATMTPAFKIKKKLFEDNYPNTEFRISER